MVPSARAVFVAVLLFAPACSIGLVGERGPEGPRGPQGARGERGEPGATTVVTVDAPAAPPRDLIVLQGDGGYVGRVVSLTPELSVWLDAQQCVATLAMTDVHPGWPSVEARGNPGLATGSAICGFGTPMLQTQSVDFACQKDLRGDWYRPVQPMQLRVFRNVSQPLEDGGCLALSPNSRGLVMERVEPPDAEGPFLVVSE